MKIERFTEEDIFASALNLRSPEDRDAFLVRVLDGNETQLNRMRAMLHAHDHPVLTSSPLPEAFSAGELLTAAPVLSGEIGTCIGPYKLLEQIGEGGMGVVYVAQQREPVRRKVALKIIKPGMDSREVISRFQTERQALALMDHPNIAKVFDAGTTDSGRPYFVMELVRGMPITEFCDKVKLAQHIRLQLFVTVCQAIQHAHQKGIIHRDLKPSNILVTKNDDQMVVKVIDFGVAKALHQKLSDNTIYTAFSQIIGTPLYMSPEQAELTSLDVDTRSDIYSLGVLLYELLTGQTPFDGETLRKAGLDEMRRIIREEEPLRPSQRLSTLDAQAISTCSQQRGLDERRLRQILQGELDWIVMKALEKDRGRRYESASAFAMDVQRYLDDEPVSACPPNAVYRLKKFARRRKWLLTTAILVTFVVLVGTIVSAWQAVEATKARKLADDRLILANQRLDSEMRARTDADQNRDRASLNLRQALDAVDQMVMRVADERLAAIPGTEPVRQELYRDALRFYDEFFQQTPDDPLLRLSTARAWSRVGSLHHFLGNHSEAQSARLVAIQRWEGLHVESPDNPEIQADLAEVYGDFGYCEHWVRYRFDSAKPALMRAVELWRDLGRRFPDKVDYQWHETRIEVSLADNYKCKGRSDLAEPALRHAVDVQRQLWTRSPISGKFHPALCDSLFNLAYLLCKEVKNDPETRELCIEGVRRGEEIMARDPQSASAAARLVTTSHLYADFLKDHGEITEAEQHFRRAVEVGQLLPQINPRDFHVLLGLSRAQLALASLLAANGRGAEALVLYRRAGDAMRPVMLLAEPYSGFTHICTEADQGTVNCLKQLVSTGRGEDAARIISEMPTRNVENLLARGTVYDQMGDYASAIQDYNRVLEHVPHAWWIHRQRALAHFNSGHFEQALSDLVQVVESNPANTSALTLIAPSRAAACPDESFRAGMLNLAERVVVLTNGDLGAYRECGSLYAAMRQFDIARRKFDGAVSAAIAGNHAGWYERHQQALCYLADADPTAYREACTEMLRHFRQSHDSNEIYYTVWTCVLTPNIAPHHSEPILELARRAHALRPDDPECLLGLGATLFRIGQFQEALAPLMRSDSATLTPNSSPIYGWYFLAMTHLKLGHKDDAQRWYDKAVESTDQVLTQSNADPPTWNQQLTLELLKREAAELMGGSAPVSGLQSGIYHGSQYTSGD